MIVSLDTASGFFVSPMCRYTEFGTLMQFAGSNLHFQNLAARSGYRRMKGLVVVALWFGDVVIEFCRL